MRTAVLLLAVLVVLSGCSFLGGSGTPTPGVVTPAATSGGTPGQPTATATATGTATATRTPEGDGFDEEFALARHQSALRSTSYRLVVNVSGIRNARHTEQGASGSYPLLTTTDLPDGSATTYWVESEEFGVSNVSGVIGFSRSSVEGGTFVPVFVPGNITPSPGNRDLRNYLYTLEYTPAGTETIDGTTYSVYEANSTDALDLDRETQTPTLPRDRNVTAVNARLLIDDQDIIRSFRATYEYPNGTLEVNASVTGLGQTSVVAPGWLPEACASTDFGENVSIDCEQGIVG